MRATAARDLEQVLDLMAEEVVLLLPGRPPLRGRDAFAAALAQRFSIRAIPALLFFSGGELRQQIAGITGKKAIVESTRSARCDDANLVKPRRTIS